MCGPHWHTAWYPWASLSVGKVPSLACVYLQDLCADLLCNPHSTEGDGDSDWAGAGAGAAADARAATLALCNAPPEEYVCVFTSGATGPPSSSNAEVVREHNPCKLCCQTTFFLCQHSLPEVPNTFFE